MPWRDLATTDPLSAFERLLDEAPGTSRGENVALVVAHPDDEVIALGGHLNRLPNIRIVHLTDGAPRNGRDAEAKGFATVEAYAAARRTELVAGLKEAGISPDRLTGFNLADQATAHHLPDLAQKLADLFEAEAIALVLTHPFEGGHPDHDSASFAVRAACRLLQRAGKPAPGTIEFTSYHQGPAGRVYNDFAQAPATRVLEITLSPEDSARKARMLACHASQQSTLGPFGTTLERFRAAPAYDYANLPNGGRILYDEWGFALTGADWLKQSRAALQALELA
jgi:N-acetylglucosamine malate deacetylase 2